jgi:hypothetical protein
VKKKKKIFTMSAPTADLNGRRRKKGRRKGEVKSRGMTQKRKKEAGEVEGQD